MVGAPDGIPKRHWRMIVVDKTAAALRGGIIVGYELMHATVSLHDRQRTVPHGRYDVRPAESEGRRKQDDVCAGQDKWMQLLVRVWAVGETSGIFSFCDDDIGEILIRCLYRSPPGRYRPSKRDLRSVSRSRTLPGHPVRLANREQFRSDFVQARADPEALAGNRVCRCRRSALWSLADEFVERRVGLGIVDPMRYAVKVKRFSCRTESSPKPC